MTAESDTLDGMGEITRRPGKDWTDAERALTVALLNRPGVLRRMLLVAARNLGSGTTSEDAEDTWQEFFTKRPVRQHTGRDVMKAKVDDVIQTYRPEQHSFLGYFELCFRRECWRARRRLDRHAGLEQPLPSEEDGSSVLVQLVVDADGDAMVWELRDAAEECINALPGRSREALVLRMDNLPERRIAEELEMSDGALRVLLFRARAHVRRCLTSKGFLYSEKQTQGTKEADI